YRTLGGWSGMLRRRSDRGVLIAMAMAIHLRRNLNWWGPRERRWNGISCHIVKSTRGASLVSLESSRGKHCNLAEEGMRPARSKEHRMFWVGGQTMVKTRSAHVPGRRMVPQSWRCTVHCQREMNMVHCQERKKQIRFSTMPAR